MYVITVKKNITEEEKTIQYNVVQYSTVKYTRGAYESKLNLFINGVIGSAVCMLELSEVEAYLFCKDWQIFVTIGKYL